LSDWNELLDSVNNNVIGIINSNNDSFTGDGIYKNKDNLTRLLASAKNNGIDLIDVGCVSTKPNFKDISQEEEFKRLNFFLDNYDGDFKLSIDTMKKSVAEYSLDNNFEILNDVSGFRNSEMIELAADRNSKIILVHNHPESSRIHEKMEFKNVVQEVKAHLESKIVSLISNGIKENRISIDPGLGFGKTMEDSKVLFENLDAFCFGFPLIVGYSKKKFTEALNLTNSQLYQHCIDSGVALVRLHIAS
jgi:dihydropteroate synthase